MLTLEPHLTLPNLQCPPSLSSLDPPSHSPASSDPSVAPASSTPTLSPSIAYMDRKPDTHTGLRTKKCMRIHTHSVCIQVPPFTSPVGPAVPVPSSPLGIFQLFFTEELLEEIVSQSNRYAKQVLEEEAYSQWDAITVEELKAFIGFCLLMGVKRLPAIYDYWKRDPFYRYSPIADRISRKRFRDLFRFLHFADNETLVPRGVDGHDRLGKVRPLIDYGASRLLVPDLKHSLIRV